MDAYQVKLPVFEGPFDLLYHLIEEQQIDIYDIPIARITEQYLEHIQMMEILDMEIASEFLVMAATLIDTLVNTRLGLNLAIEKKHQDATEEIKEIIEYSKELNEYMESLEDDEE